VTAIERLFKLAGGADATDDNVRRVGQQHPESWRDALLEVQAALAARQRREELERYAPAFAKAVDAVADARAHGAHITLGRDAGHRQGVGVVKIAGPADDGGAPGPAERAIKRRLRRGRVDP